MTRTARQGPLLHPRLIGPGAALLTAAFVTDLLYWRTLLGEWETFSIWLLTAGLILAAFAGIAFLLDLLLQWAGKVRWWRFLALTIAALLSLLNAFIHSRDGYAAVVPQGLALSAIVTLLLLCTGWSGWSLATARLPVPASPEGVRP